MKNKKYTWEEINEALIQNGWTGSRIANLLIELNRLTSQTMIISWETLNWALIELNIPAKKITKILAKLNK